MVYIIAERESDFELFKRISNIDEESIFIPSHDTNRVVSVRGVVFIVNDPPICEEAETLLSSFQTIGYLSLRRISFKR